GHGVAMLPDVALEAGAILSADEVLAHAYPVRKQVLAEMAERFRAKENVSAELIEQVKAILMAVRPAYVRSAFQTLRDTVRDSPKSHGTVIATVDAVVSELRNQGWSDEA